MSTQSKQTIRYGICTKCKEHTQVPGSCCGANIISEGSVWSDDDFCGCNDCIDSPESACRFDCDRDSECAGCLKNREGTEETEFEQKCGRGEL